jgi:hypothetical protein
MHSYTHYNRRTSAKPLTTLGPTVGHTESSGKDDGGGGLGRTPAASLDGERLWDSIVVNKYQQVSQPVECGSNRHTLGGGGGGGGAATAMR